MLNYPFNIGDNVILIKGSVYYGRLFAPYYSLFAAIAPRSLQAPNNWVGELGRLFWSSSSAAGFVGGGDLRGGLRGNLRGGGGY